MPDRHETFGIFGARYTVNATDRTYEHLAPVTLTVSTGIVHFQDYLTPTEAELLASLLVEAARRARDHEPARA